MDPNFSKIKKYPPDFKLYPLYYDKNNIVHEFTITPGQCLYIPKNWWHWVFTYADTISVTSWDTIEDSTPYVFEQPIFKTISNKWTNDYLTAKLQNDLLYCYFTKEVDLLTCDFSTFMTQPFYFSTYAHPDNLTILNKFQPDIDQLYKDIKINKPWYNIWILPPTLPEVDSGLHFDEGYSNYLIVLRGKKKVLLFPPENSQYLYKIESQYSLAKSDQISN